MSRVFKNGNTLEIVEFIRQFPFKRQITSILLHTGDDTSRDSRSAVVAMEGLWHEQVRLQGLADVGCHISIDVNGMIWLGRNFNWPPAGFNAHSGTLEAGPFALTLLGPPCVPSSQPFSKQIMAALSVIKALQLQCNLSADVVRVELNPSAVDTPAANLQSFWFEAVQAFALQETPRQRTNVPFRVRASRAHELIKAMKPDHIPMQAFFDQESPAHANSDSPTETRNMNTKNSIDDDMLDELSQHVINLERGKFSRGGRIETGKGDVDRLFEELLPAEIALRRKSDKKAKVVFYAHGGLVSEKNALINAYAQLEFWRANDVYPIFFIWETGFAETLRQLIKECVTRSGRKPGARDLSDISDAFIEELARAAGGKLVWGAMQSSAELSSSKGSGGAYVVRKLLELVEVHGADLEIHAVGHSAGSIFHTHFLKALADNDIVTKTVSFLAPAVTTRLFSKKLAPLLGKSVGPVTIFTMNKNRERKDTVTPFYRKSLLYLVYEALEPKRRTNLLGLEVSLRNDDTLRSIFGLRGKRSDKGQIVFSPGGDTDSGSGSQSLTHGGFDNDAATMESVLRRILRKTRGEPIEPFTATASRSMEDFWSGQFEWPAGMEDLATSAVADEDISSANFADSETPANSHPGPAPADGQHGDQQSNGAAHNGAEQNTAGSKTSGTAESSNGAQHHQGEPQNAQGSDFQHQGEPRKLALCIGIDTYKRQPLNCCVKDAKSWNKTLKSLGYKTMEPLLNAAATGDAIRARMTDLVRSCQPGDHIVLQYAGHGTQIRDVNGDESEGGERFGKNDEGSRDGKDECLCAVDCDDSENGLVLDDEIRIIINQLPEGASITCFFDCCHSGSMSRAAPPAQGNALSRQLEPSEMMKRAYENRRSTLPASRGGAAASQVQRGVVFSACKDSELAWESDGQGDFTRHSLAVIKDGLGRLSNMDFNSEVVARFGSPRRQTPQIDAAESAYKRPFMNVEAVKG